VFEITSDNPVSQELVDKYPLPEGYFWSEGTPQRWPSVRKGSLNNNQMIVSYRYQETYGEIQNVRYWASTDGEALEYPVSSPEDAVRLVQALLLFGETQ